MNTAFWRTTCIAVALALFAPVLGGSSEAVSEPQVWTVDSYFDFGDLPCTTAHLALTVQDNDRHTVSRMSAVRGPFSDEPLHWDVGPLAPGRYFISGTIVSCRRVQSPIPELALEVRSHDISKHLFIAAAARGSALQAQYFDAATRIDGRGLLDAVFDGSSVTIGNRQDIPLQRCNSVFGGYLRLDWLIDDEWDEGWSYSWQDDLAVIPPHGEAIFGRAGVYIVKKHEPGRMVAPAMKRLLIPVQPSAASHVRVNPTTIGPLPAPPCDHYYLELPVTDDDPRFSRPLVDEETEPPQ